MAEPTVPAPGSESAAGPAQEPTRAREQYELPPVDIYEDEQGLVVVADLPGVDPDTLDVRVDRGILTLRAQPATGVPAAASYREFETPAFFRQFQLSEEIDPARIAADFKHGVLTLRLPRAERQQPRKITVRLG